MFVVLEGLNLPNDVSERIAPTKNPVVWMSVGIVVSSLMLVFLSFRNAELLVRMQDQKAHRISTERLKGEILTLDERLTSSARLFAKTQEEQWSAQYNSYVPKLDEALLTSKDLTPTYIGDFGAEMTNAANDELIAFETQAFEAVESDRPSEAWRILSGPEYLYQKNIYSLGMTRFASPIEKLERVAEVASTIQYLHEVQSKSALLYSVTGDAFFRKRYQKARSEVDAQVEEALVLAATETLTRGLDRSQIASEKLSEMVNVSFDHVEANRLAEAYATLNGSEFSEYSLRYEKSLQGLLDDLDVLFAESRRNEREILTWQTIFSATTIAILVAGLSFVFASIKRWQDQLLVKNAKLSELNEDLEQFAYRSSHDLKAPLSSIKGLARFIEEDLAEGDVDESSKNARKILKQATKLEELVVSILDLARADLGTEEYEQVNAEKLISDLRDKFESQLLEKGVAIESEIRLAEMLWVQKARVTQVLENLVLNSIKYSDPGISNRFVRVGFSQSEEAIIIAVEDNGLGIPEDDQSEVFTAFTRFHPSQAEGSGLGMSVIKRHIERLRGSIAFASSPEGTKFTISIPKRKDTEHPI